MSQELIILVITVFFARLIDVTLRTIRTIFLIEGKRYRAALIGVFEVSIWLLVIRDAINANEGVVYVALAYGLGFALGHIVGISIIERFVKQTYKIIIVTSSTNNALLKALRNKQFGVTKIEATGILEDKKYYLYLEILSQRLDLLKAVINQYDPDAFLTIHKSKDAINGHFY